MLRSVSSPTNRLEFGLLELVYTVLAKPLRMVFLLGGSYLPIID